MDRLTGLIEQEIKRQYKSVRQFSAVMGIPNSTVVSAIKHGVSGTAYDTVIRICQKLNIDLTDYTFPMLLTTEGKRLLLKYNTLDEKGQHSINAILELEYQRCCFPENIAKIKNGKPVQRFSKEYIQSALNELDRLEQEQ